MANSIIIFPFLLLLILGIYFINIWTKFLQRERRGWLHGKSDDDYIFIGPYICISTRWLSEKVGLTLEETKEIVTESRCPKWLVKFIDDEGATG